MTMPWPRQLDIYLRALAPFATALLAVLIDLLPLPGAGLERVTSFSTLGVVYFWSLYRPDLFTNSAAFATGLIYDALAGLPLGLSSLLLLLVRNLMVTQQRFFVARSFPVIWACFVVLAPAIALLRWLIVSLWFEHSFAFPPLLVELLLTIALYPLVSWLLGHVHNRVPRWIHAP
jgi:rod shape-determining protein MreD